MLLLAAHVPSAIALINFTPSAFLIRRQIGQLGFATETEWQYFGGRPNPLDPSQPKRTVEASGVSVRLFDAKLDDGARVLLKEFIGDAREIGANEAAMYEMLYDNAAASGAPRPAQVGRLVGRMVADASFTSPAFRSDWAIALPGTPPPSEDGLWLVFAWEPLRTVAGFASQPQERSFFDFDGSAAAEARRLYVRRAAAAILDTCSWLHGQGVVHRSLGTSSLILSTYRQSEAPRVMAIDLGFATSASRLSADDVASAMARGPRKTSTTAHMRGMAVAAYSCEHCHASSARSLPTSLPLNATPSGRTAIHCRPLATLGAGASSPLDVVPFCTRADDLHALAYVLLELLLGASVASSAAASGGGVLAAAAAAARGGRDNTEGESQGGGSSATASDLQTLKRLVEDVFAGDVCGQFRAYCTEEAEWAAAVTWLDEGGGEGWRLIESLVACRDPRDTATAGMTARSLRESSWFAEV